MQGVMKNRNRNNLRQTRLDRVERKCDRILSELIIIREQLNRRPDMDTAIERIHLTARSMRVQFERERNNIRRMFNSKFME